MKCLKVEQTGKRTMLFYVTVFAGWCLLNLLSYPHFTLAFHKVTTILYFHFSILLILALMVSYRTYRSTSDKVLAGKNAALMAALGAYLFIGLQFLGESFTGQSLLGLPFSEWQVRNSFDLTMEEFKLASQDFKHAMNHTMAYSPLISLACYLFARNLSNHFCQLINFIDKCSPEDDFV